MAAAALVAVLACTPVAEPQPVASSVSPSPTPEPIPTPPVVRFEPARVERTIRQIATLGTREASSAGYRLAAAFVARAFRDRGYGVRRQRFEVPSGRVDGIRVPSGTSFNVIAEPDGFDPRAPHLVVGGHLDTVPDTVGANDNASGVAMTLELARLAALEPPRLPVVFVAFGGEERRRQSPDESQYAIGARTYVAEMGARRRAAVRGFVDLDMVGAGRLVHHTGSGRFYAHLLQVARARDLQITPIVTNYFSDHVAFREAGLPYVWLWAGEHGTLHTPGDRPKVIERAELRRIGRLAWEAIDTY